MQSAEFGLALWFPPFLLALNYLHLLKQAFTLHLFSHPFPLPSSLPPLRLSHPSAVACLCLRAYLRISFLCRFCLNIPRCYHPHSNPNAHSSVLLLTSYYPYICILLGEEPLSPIKVASVQKKLKWTLIGFIIEF